MGMILCPFHLIYFLPPLPGARQTPYNNQSSHHYNQLPLPMPLLLPLPLLCTHSPADRVWYLPTPTPVPGPPDHLCCLILLPSGTGATGILGLRENTLGILSCNLEVFLQQQYDCFSTSDMVRHKGILYNSLT